MLGHFVVDTSWALPLINGRCLMLQFVSMIYRKVERRDDLLRARNCRCVSLLRLRKQLSEARTYALHAVIDDYVCPVGGSLPVYFRPMVKSAIMKFGGQVHNQDQFPFYVALSSLKDWTLCRTERTYKRL